MILNQSNCKLYFSTNPNAAFTSSSKALAIPLRIAPNSTESNLAAGRGFGRTLLRVGGV